MYLGIPIEQMFSYQHWSVPSGPKKKVGGKKGFCKNHGIVNYNEDNNDWFNFDAILIILKIYILQLNAKHV